MKTFALGKYKQGGKSITASIFIGESLEDPKMLDEVKLYLKLWLAGYTDISHEETEELFKDFKGFFTYDGWEFDLVEMPF